MTTNKLRNMKEIVDANYYRRNNIDPNLRNSLKKLKTNVSNNNIVICKSDKDGKIIVVNHKDYIEIINRELEGYTLINEKSKLIEKNMKDNKRIAEEMVIKLYKDGFINEEMLYHVTGWIKTKQQNLSKITGPKAKYFTNLDPGYIYPLFKTHKLHEKDLENVAI